MAIDSVVHRPGVFKKPNKQHKSGRHRTKGSISKDGKGKVSVKTISKKAKTQLNREQRRHQALQIRRNKRDEVLSKKRSLGGMDYAPFLVCVLPLHKDFDPATTISLFTQCDSEAVVNKSPSGITHICLPRFKQRFSFVVPPKDYDFAVLDALKICDTVVYLISTANGVGNDDDLIDKWGYNILLSSFAQGLPTPIVGVTNLESITPKKRHEAKQRIQKLVEKWFPDDKVVPLDKDADAMNVLRKIGNQKRKSVLYRDKRPHLFAEEVEYVTDQTGPMGTLKITGYLRGSPLSVNSLVHIPGLGDFQMTQIDAPVDPYSVDKNKNPDVMESDEERYVRVLEKCDSSKQESLQSELQPEPEDVELPSASEEGEQQEPQTSGFKPKRVPKGWSNYQAAWIPEGDDALLSNSESENESDQDEDDVEDMDAVSEDRSEASDDEGKEFDTATESEVAVNTDRYDQQMDFYAEKEALDKMKAAKSDLEFPDEIDTPLEVPARERFKKYSGLESFRTSPWEDDWRPSDYDRIYHFKNFHQTARNILKQQKDIDGAMPGWYITVHVKNVSQLLWSTFKTTEAPVVMIGLFPHEHKMSVVNVVLKRTPNFPIPIKSKDRLIFQCGFRRFSAAPIFSQHTNGNKHKFERFFQPESVSVATFYAPIQFPPAPVLCYKEVNNNLVLVATGSLLHCNPERIVLKRIVLSGYPLKIHKRSAVIRFMFFNREDIVHFKSVRLRTKMGRIGNIKEPLGTHGHMKCIFDGQMKSEDTVLLNLYKRVFPKWSYDDLVVSCLTNNEKMDM